MFSAEPVCSCALFFVQLAHETAGAARTRLSLLPLMEGQSLANLGHIVPRECEGACVGASMPITQLRSSSSAHAGDPVFQRRRCWKREAAAYWIPRMRDNDGLCFGGAPTLSEGGKPGDDKWSGSWKVDFYRLGRNSSHVFRVVPAQAGTHTHECQLLRCVGAPIPFIKNIGGYGSWLSPGRRGGEQSEAIHSSCAGLDGLLRARNDPVAACHVLSHRPRMRGVQYAAASRLKR